MKSILFLTLCVMAMIGVVFGVIPYTIVTNPGDVPSFSWSVPGPNFVLMSHGNGIFSIYNRQSDGTWANRTSGAWNPLTDISGTLLSAPSSAGVKKIHDNTILGFIYDNTATDYQYFRITYDHETSTFGSHTWSSVFSDGIVDVVSPDLSKTMRIVFNSPNTNIYTYRWTGTDYVLAGTKTIGYYVGSNNVYLGNEVFMHGHTGDVHGVDRQGSAYLYSWNSGTNHWETTEDHKFICPTISGQESCASFGTFVWVNEAKTKAIVSAISSHKFDSSTQAGAYVQFTDSGSGWNTPSQTFPDNYCSSSANCGRIQGTPNDKGVLVYLSTTNWYAFWNEDGVYRNKKPPFVYGDTSVRPTSQFSVYSYGDEVVVHRYQYSSGNIPADSQVIFSTKLQPSEMYWPASVKTILSPVDVANTNFGGFPVVAGDYVATCSYQKSHDSDTTKGELFIYKKNLGTGDYDFVDSIGPGSLAESTIGFCQYSMSFDGSTAVVGAQNEDIGGTGNRGAVYIFDFDGTTLTLNTKKTAPVDETSQQFGNKVVVDGEHLVVASPYTDIDGFSNRGDVYAYKKTGGVWGDAVPFHKPIANPLDSSDYYGRDIDVSGTKACISSSQQGSSGVNKGVVVIYNYNGTGWEIEQELEGQSGTINSGQSCGVDGEWAFMGASYSEIQMFKWNGASWVFHELLREDALTMSETSAATTDRIFLRGNILVSGQVTDTYNGGNNDGTIRVFHFDGSSWKNSDGKVYSNPNKLNTDTSSVGNHIHTDGASVVWSNYPYGGAPYTNGGVGRLFAHTIFITCSSSAQCQTGQYCDPNDSCVPQKACTEHSDCIGELRTNRLPYCDKDAGVCKDVYEGSCSSATACDSKHKKRRAVANKLGSITQNVATGNLTQAREVAIQLYTQLQENTDIVQNLTTFISGTESANFPIALFDTYGDDDGLLASIKNLVCPPEVRELCEISQGSRRRLSELRGRSLQSGGVITVEITYEIDSDAYDQMVNNATTFSDGSAFEQALADQLGLSTDNVTITAVDGQLVIEYVVSQEAEGDDPLSEENLAALEEVSASLDNITDTVVQELGIDSTDIESTSVDYCEGRDCNGRGTCDTETGICACDSPEYWGINCETSVTCGPGERANNTAYCICEYPIYGQRCQYTANCSC